MTQSAYIHIPFCKSKCKYCSFISYVKEDSLDEYIKALISEIEHFYKNETLNTVYFGGGTPSLLPPSYIRKILDKLNTEPSAEITFEINPDDANLKYLTALKTTGVNRLSFGAQSFNDEILSHIGRRHNASDTINAVKSAQDSGFENISLDLIYGLPNQTLDLLEADTEIIKSLKPQHISTYGLKIEQNSYFGRNLPENLPDDDTQADMYIFLNEIFNEMEFNRYEVSNFALKGFESKHNLNYWENNEYYGFGAAAHGYTEGKRYSNKTNLQEYISNPFEHKTSHIVTEEEKLEEEIFLGLRKESGIDTTKINKKFNIDFDEKYKTVLDNYSPKYIAKTDRGYKLTLDGTLISNLILADFLT